MPIDYTKPPRPGHPADDGATPGDPPGPSAGSGKVLLTKSNPRVSLSKSAAGGVARVNLNWTMQTTETQPPPRGFFGKLKAGAAPMSPGAVDLDLGCLFELADGHKGVVQALGGAFGELNRPPWIALDGDDRTGNVTGGENLSINLKEPNRFRRVLIFAMIYEGAPNWAAADGVVTLKPASGEPIEVRLDESDDRSRLCAVAQLVQSGDELVFQREVRYIHGGQRELDKCYGWGMHWTRGYK